MKRVTMAITFERDENTSGICQVDEMAIFFQDKIKIEDFSFEEYWLPNKSKISFTGILIEKDEI